MTKNLGSLVKSLTGNVERGIKGLDIRLMIIFPRFRNSLKIGERPKKMINKKLKKADEYCFYPDDSGGRCAGADSQADRLPTTER